LRPQNKPSQKVNSNLRGKVFIMGMEIVHEFPFGQIIKLQDNLAEVIGKPGVEFNLTMTHEYHNWLRNNLQAPFGILVNKKNSYTYTFAAQMNIGTLPEAKALAIVEYSQLSEEATNILLALPRRKKMNVRIFHNREVAIAWLQAELAQ